MQNWRYHAKEIGNAIIENAKEKERKRFRRIEELARESKKIQSAITRGRSSYQNNKD